MIEWTVEYFERKVERVSEKIHELHSVGYGAVDISKILGLPVEMVEVKLEV